MPPRGKLPGEAPYTFIAVAYWIILTYFLPLFCDVIPFGKQDKPFKYEEDNTIKSFTVTLNAMGMLTGSTSFTVTDSVSIVTIDADCFGAPPSDGFFGWWMDGRGCKVSDEITFSATITSDTTFTACYLYNNPLCQALASTVKNAVLGENVGEFLALVGKGAKVEHSYLGRVNGTSVTNDHFTQNERGKVNSQLHLNSKYMYYIHNHPSNIPLPSGQDLLSLYYCIKNGLDYNTNLFRYIITSDNLIVYYYIVDSQSFKKYFDDISLKKWVDDYKTSVDKFIDSTRVFSEICKYIKDKYLDRMGVNMIFQSYNNDLNDSDWQTEFGKSESNNCLKNR